MLLLRGALLLLGASQLAQAYTKSYAPRQAKRAEVVERGRFGRLQPRQSATLCTTVRDKNNACCSSTALARDNTCCEAADQYKTCPSSTQTYCCDGGTKYDDGNHGTVDNCWSVLHSFH